MAQTKGGLGKGMSALFADYEDNREVKIDSAEGTVNQLDITLIDRNPEQARKSFDESSLKEMAESMKLYGVLQPLLVTKAGERYQIVAGERRFRAALMAGLKNVPAIIKDLPIEEIKAISLIENIQRENLNPIEEAEGIKELMTGHGLTQEGVADRLGKSRPYVANSLRLLTLPKEVIDMVKTGQLTTGHARAMVSVEDKDFIINLAKQTVQYKLTVREVEERVRLYYSRQSIPAGPRKAAPLTLELKELVNDMKRVFGTRVKLVGTPEKGRFSIDYFTKDDLERIYQLIEQLKENQ